VANSTPPPKRAKRDRPQKPRPDFPLFPHATGRWAKKVRGKFTYFTRWADDPKGEAALNLWLDQKDDLLAGRTPRGNREGLTIADLCNRFLTAKEQQRDVGDIKSRSFAEYLGTCKTLVAAFGRNRLVDDLAADDFQSLRAALSKQYGPHRLGGEVQRTRTLFKFADDFGLIDRKIRFGPTFKRPSKRIMRAHRQKSPPKMFEAADLQAIIDTADQPMRAMIFLAINCGFGNHDVGTLPMSALDLKADWVNFPRPKTAIERRCPLWPETIRAIQESIEQRPTPKLSEHSKLVFVTKYGGPWASDTPSSPVSQEFRKLLDRLKLHRPGLGFYAMRHTLETIAGESKDQVAVNQIMGRADSSMAGVYRERISDERLCDVVNLVRAWLFPKRKPK